MLESQVYAPKDEWDENRRNVKVWNREHPEIEAKIAFSLVERWGLVAGVPDGEDSAGRQKLRLATNQELVDRACNVAALLVNRCRSNDWIHVSPSMIQPVVVTPPPETEEEQ